jgi:hypothetical protein
MRPAGILSSLQNQNEALQRVQIRPTFTGMKMRWASRAYHNSAGQAIS